MRVKCVRRCLLAIYKVWDVKVVQTLEIGTASTEPKRVRSLETVGGGKRTAGNGRQSGNVRGSVECLGTPGGRLREFVDVEVG